MFCSVFLHVSRQPKENGKGPRAPYHTLPAATFYPQSVSTRSSLKLWRRNLPHPPVAFGDHAFGLKTRPVT